MIVELSNKALNRFAKYWKPPFTLCREEGSLRLRIQICRRHGCEPFFAPQSAFFCKSNQDTNWAIHKSRFIISKYWADNFKVLKLMRLWESSGVFGKKGGKVCSRKFYIRTCRTNLAATKVTERIISSDWALKAPFNLDCDQLRHKLILCLWSLQNFARDVTWRFPWTESTKKAEKV